MEMAVAAVIAGLIVLVWSADRFVTGAAAADQGEVLFMRG